MIDSHCHLTDPRLLEQLSEVLSRAAAAGVSRMISIGTDIQDDRDVIALCRGRDSLRCAIGIHPNYCHEARIEDVEALRSLQSDPAVVALGEMGLDYHHNFADHATQSRFFEAQLVLAAELDRPVVIHCREATEDCLAIMRSFPAVRAVFHCFTGTMRDAERILGAGYALGFTGAVTFKRNDELRKVAALTPKDRLLIETDAPYMSPEPLRSQKTNEPSFVPHVAAVIARAWGTTIEDVDRITSANAMSFFGWK